MAVLNFKQKKECKYDILSLGEVMIRLDPGEMLASSGLLAADGFLLRV